MVKLSLNAKPLSLQILTIATILVSILQILVLLDVFPQIQTWVMPTILSGAIGLVLFVEADYHRYLKASAAKRISFDDGLNIVTFIAAGFLLASTVVGISFIQQSMPLSIMDFFKNTQAAIVGISLVLFVVHMFKK